MQDCWHASAASTQLYQKRGVTVPKTSIATSQITPHTALTASKKHCYNTAPANLMQSKTSVLHAFQLVCYSRIKLLMDSSASCSAACSRSKSCPMLHYCSPKCCIIDCCSTYQHGWSCPSHLLIAPSIFLSVLTGPTLCHDCCSACEHEMCAQAVSAMAVSPWAQYPPRIAVAMRANKRNARVMVYEVLVGADAGSPFGSSALCVSQANIAESLTIKVLTSIPSPHPVPHACDTTTHFLCSLIDRNVCMLTALQSCGCQVHCCRLCQVVLAKAM